MRLGIIIGVVGLSSAPLWAQDFLEAGPARSPIQQSPAGADLSFPNQAIDPDESVHAVLGEEVAPLIVPDQETAPISGVENERASFLLATGSAYAEEGEVEQAERAYRMALELDSTLAAAWIRLGFLYVDSERFEEAVNCFQKQLAFDPESPLAHNNLAWCYAVGPGVRNVALALRHSRDALLYAPKVPSIWNTLAEAYYVSGNYDNALRSAEYALELLREKEPVNRDDEQAFEDQIFKIKQAQDAAKMMFGF